MGSLFRRAGEKRYSVAWIDAQGKRRTKRSSADKRNPPEVFCRAIGQVGIQAGADSVRHVREEKGVTVRGCLGYRVGTKRRARAGTVLHHDGLTEDGGEPLT